jgi:hypothetical protein
MDSPRTRRRSAPFFLGLAAILAALPLGWFLFLHQPPAPPPPPVEEEAPPPLPPVEQPTGLQLQEVQGTVEVRRGDTWHPAHVGEALHPSDAVRTREGSYAVLIGGEAVEVRMEPGTEVSVEQLTDSLSRLLLANGMTTARVRPGTRHTFEVYAAGSDAVARTQGGTFSISNNSQGTVAVGTREGEVTFIGQGKVVIVRAGQQSIVRPGRGPSEPTPIPSSLLLKVDWPARPSVRKRKLVISGQTEPGGRVEVDGQPLLPDAEGRFSHPVSLKEGRNTVRVRALSVGGAQGEDGREFTLDTTPPQGVAVDPGLWK